MSHSPLTPETRTTLHALLDANASFAMNGKGTTNHFPMAAIALAELGADSQRLQAFFTHWQEKYALPSEAVSAELTQQTWLQQLGKPEQFANLRVFFTTWLQEAGHKQVLSEVFQVLPFAPATGAFHALIRLAYGLHAAHNGEIAASLAYMVAAHLPLPLLANCANSTVSSPELGFATLAAHMAGREYAGTSITGKLRQVAEDADFLASLPNYPLTLSDLPALAHLAIAVYWQTKNFTALHMVTGLHAARIVLQELPPAIATSLLAPIWVAIAAAYVSIGAPQVQGHASLLAQVPAQEQDWPRIFALAVASDNDHVIKFCYTSHQENLQYASALYFAAAARLVVR